MKSKAERLVHLLTALATVEEVGLDVVEDREKHTARLVSRAVAVSTGNALGEGRCEGYKARCSD